MVKGLMGVEGGLGLGPGVFFSGATIAGAGLMGGLGKFQSLASFPFIGDRIRKQFGNNQFIGPLLPTSPAESTMKGLEKFMEKHEATVTITPPGSSKEEKPKG